MTVAKYTLTRNTPTGHRSQSRPLPFQVLVKPSHGLAPSISGGLGPVAAPGIAVKSVAGTGIHVELMGLTMALQLGLHLRHIGRGGALVLLTEQAQHRHANIGRLRQGAQDATAIEHHRRLQIGNVTGGQV